MSHETVAWAAKVRGVDPPAKLVLFCLAVRHNPKNGTFPSHARLADDSGLSRATVIRKLALLEEAGHIRRVRPQQNAGKRRRSMNYLLAIDPGFVRVNMAEKCQAECLSLRQEKRRTMRQADGISLQQSIVSGCDTNLYIEKVSTEDPPNPPPASFQNDSAEDVAAWIQTLALTAPTRPAFCDALAEAIRQRGHEVRRNFTIDDRGDGRSGIVDLVILRAGRPWLAIAVDRTSPSSKSTAKLAEFEAGLIVLRESTWSGGSFEGFPVLHFGTPTAISDLVNAIIAQHRLPINQGQLDDAIDNRMREWGEYPINCFKLAVIEALETCVGFLDYVNERIVAAPRPPRARPLRDLAGLRAAAAALAGEA